MNCDLTSIRKSATDRVCKGVCGGLGEHTTVPSWMWRVLFVVGACWSGGVILAYIMFSYFMPDPVDDKTAA